MEYIIKYFIWQIRMEWIGYATVVQAAFAILLDDA